MAAPSNTVPAAAAAAAAGLSPTNANVGFFTYVREVVSGTATLLQEAPLAVATETAGLLNAVPVVGIVCKTFLSFEELVETARSNKDDLATLHDLCDVVIEGVLDKRSDRSGLLKGFEALEKHVKQAEEVAKLCNNGRVKTFVLARKICKDIASVRNDVLAFCTANNLVLANDTHAKFDKWATVFDAKLEKMEKLTVTQDGYEAMKEEVEGLRKEVETKEKASLDVEVELRWLKEVLGTMKAELEEQRRVADLASKVKVPPGAPRIRDWFVERTARVVEACDRFGIGSSTSDPFEEPRMVGVAGPGGSGKSAFASMVMARDDVKAHFYKGMLWLQVGKGAKFNLPELMIRLADMVFETVMRKGCRPPQKADLESDPEDGAAYIREVVDESSRRFLVVADDVWDVEVLEALRTVGAWVLYTTRQDDLLREAPPLRLDQVLQEEAEMVLRRAADLDDDAHLPDTAYDLMELCGFGVMYLAFIGRWSGVRGRGRSEGKAWQMALGRIVEAQKGGKGGQLLSWRAAVLRAGLDELVCDNPQNKELYLSLAVMPQGLAFPSEVAAVLLYDGELSAGDLEAAGRIAATLERWSILTLEDGGKYRVHDEHADFIQERFAANQDTRDKALPRWRGHISSVRALLTFSSGWLVKIWAMLAQFDGKGVIPRPYDVALDAMDPVSADRRTAFRRAARFHWRRKDWLEAFNLNFQLLEIEEKTGGVDPLDLANTLHNLGRCGHRTGKTKEAEGFYRRALAIQEEKLGANHPHVAHTLHNLGGCVDKAGRTEEAEKLYQRSLAILEEMLGADDADVGIPKLYSLEPWQVDALYTLSLSHR